MQFRIDTAALQSLIEVLRQRKYTVVGPTQRGGAIVYDEITSTNDLPAGWTDEQGPGHYRIRKRSDNALFGYAVGPHSWKKYLFNPVVTMFRASRRAKSFVVSKDGQAEKIALVGVRACELHAIEIQDAVFTSETYQDPLYRSRRDQLFVVAVNCSTPAETCFCSSMNTGPKVAGKCDIVLTEVVDGQDRWFVGEASSQPGESVLAKIQHRPATTEEIAKAEEVIAGARASIKRSLETDGIKELLYRNAEHQEWDKVGERCLSCTNCTMVCPTCFCSSIEDSTDLTGSEAIRTRKWDSCFTMDFSYIHGGSIRTSTKSRYRQWMTHKLASWQDQFGTVGCVGCGRCITWCPVGIDITDEARVIRDSTHVEH